MMMDAQPMASTSARSSPVKQKAQLRPEPLLEDNPDRFCMFPIKYPQVWEMYKRAEASFWTGENLPSLALLRRTLPGAACQSRLPHNSARDVFGCLSAPQHAPSRPG